jgi:hypothetical protein
VLRRGQQGQDAARGRGPGAGLRLLAHHLGLSRLAELYAAQHDERQLADAFRERFDAERPDELSREHQLIIVAWELDPATERIVEHVAGFGVPVKRVLDSPFGGDPRLAA